MSEHAAAMAEACRDFNRVEVTTRDGVRLSAYELGRRGAPVVAIVNPIGVPIVISSRLARQLGEKYRVICWEQRGYGTVPSDFHRMTHDYGSYVADLEDVLAWSASDVAALVGVCSGAALVISAVARNMIRPSSVALVCPAVRYSAGYVPSMFDSAFVPYMRMISAGNQPLAREFLNMRAAYAKEPRGGALDLDEQLIEAADTVSLRTLDGLVVYARTIQVFTDQVLDTDISRVKQKVAVFATADDRTASIHSIRRLCKLLPDAELHEYAKGGHFAVFVREDVRQKIVRVIEAGPGAG